MSLDGKTVLVTGGAGFIGSTIVDALLTRGARVRVLDNLTSGFEENLVAARDDIELIEGDILDADAVASAARGADQICHQAAQLEITTCIDAPVEDLRSNTEGTLNVLEAARHNEVPKVVWASSACVYGQALTVPQPESHQQVPNWPYGISKLAAEHYARIYHEYYGLETVGLRYSIVYGPREWYGRVLTAFLRRALAGEPPVIWGGSQLRDFVYVDDVVSANIAAMEQDGLGNSVFNVSTGRGTSVRELADLVSATFELPEPIVEDIAEGETSALVDGRMRLPAELERMVLDPSALSERLGWAPATELPGGIISEMEWLRGNVDRWSVMHY